MTLRYHTPLNPEEQLAAGLDHTAPMAMGDMVRYGELDILQHVNNTAYLIWTEAVRTRHLKMMVMPHYDGMEEPRTVIRNASIHYIKEMLRDEPYVVTAKVTEFRNTSYTMEQEIWSGDKRAHFDCVVVMRTPDGSAGYPLPESLKRYFEEVEGAKRLG